MSNQFTPDGYFDTDTADELRAHIANYIEQTVKPITEDSPPDAPLIIPLDQLNQLIYNFVEYLAYTQDEEELVTTTQQPTSLN